MTPPTICHKIHLTYLQLADQRHQSHCSAEFNRASLSLSSRRLIFQQQQPFSVSSWPCFLLLVSVVSLFVCFSYLWFCLPIYDTSAQKIHISTFDSLAQNIQQRRMNWSEWEEGMWGCNLYCFHPIHITQRPPRLQCVCIVTYFWQKQTNTDNFRLSWQKNIPLAF